MRYHKVIKPIKMQHHSRLFIGVVVGFAAVFFICSLMTAFRGDDVWFAAETVKHSLPDWIMYRWSNWSSRVLPETMLWLLTSRPALWPALNTLFYVLSVMCLYRFYAVARPSRQPHGVDTTALILSCLLVWIMARGASTESVFWLTGSVNYFWISVPFLVAVYLPYAVLLGKKPSTLQAVLSLVASLVVVFSHEQFGAILAVVYILVLGRQVYRKKGAAVVRGQLAGISLAVTIGLWGVMKAPGNAIRIKQEMAQWLPDMLEVPLLVRAESCVRWLMDSIINHTGLLLIIIWCALGIILWRQRRKVVATGFFSLAVLHLFTKLALINTVVRPLLQLVYLDKLVDFHVVWRYTGGLWQWLPVICWAGALLVTVVYLGVAISKYSPQKAAVSVAGCFLAAAAAAMLWVSPTMYASEQRVLFVTSVLLGLVILTILPYAFPIQDELLNNKTTTGSRRNQTS